MKRSDVLVPVEVTSRTVRVGDVLSVGDADRTVADMRMVNDGRRHLLFAEGGSLAIGTEPVPALRPRPFSQFVPGRRP